MSGDLDDLHPLEPEEHRSQLAAVLEHAADHDRAVDLGTGLGRIARPLAANGACSVLAVDLDPRVLADPVWADAHGVERLEEDFLAEDATWHRRGPFGIASCLGNTLALLTGHDQLARLFDRAAEALRPGGRLLVDDFPVWGWAAVQAGEWPSGLSEDGEAQIVWHPGEPLFAFRSGTAVRAEEPLPLPGERLLRLWSLSELMHFASASGLEGPFHRSDHHMLTFRRP